MVSRHSIKTFIEKESTTGILLIIATITALIVANTSLLEYYNHILHLEFTIGFPELNISKSIFHWVNDGLMVLFFLLVGLEIKSELKFGQLNSVKSALFPVVAAVCGALVPAIIYYSFNYGTNYTHGWAVPMATDIAFVIGIIAILGSRVPSWVKVFITTVAVVDDLIAVLIIAFFYTESISWTALGIAALCVVVLLFLNYKKVMKLAPYLTIGFVLWWAVLASGIHATIAGVILAFTLPLNQRWNLKQTKAFTKKIFDLFKKSADKTLKNTADEAHFFIEKSQLEMESPARRLERKLRKPVYLIIMPLFAFVNAGIMIDSQVLASAFQIPITWGVIAGLFVGKQLGVLLGIWIIVKFFYKEMHINKAIWKVFHGVALLCGIGFTMSLFITNLSFSEESLLEYSKIGILVGSCISGIFGYYVLFKATDDQDAIAMDPPEQDEENQPELEH